MPENGKKKNTKAANHLANFFTVVNLLNKVKAKQDKNKYSENKGTMGRERSPKHTEFGFHFFLCLSQKLIQHYQQWLKRKKKAGISPRWPSAHLPLVILAHAAWHKLGGLAHVCIPWNQEMEEERTKTRLCSTTLLFEVSDESLRPCLKTTMKSEDSLHRNTTLFKSDTFNKLEYPTYLRWILVWPLNLTYQLLFSICEPEPFEKNISINLSHAYS